GISKMSILGSDYIGAFAVATDKFAVLARMISHGERDRIEKNLGIKTMTFDLDNSDLVGIYMAANSRAIILPNIIEEDEIAHFRKEAKEWLDVEVMIFKSSLNALGNNLLVNDKFALINPEYTAEEARELEDILGVESIRMSIGGFSTVGANNILTNKGMVLNNRATDEETEEIRKIFKGFQPSQSTANLGSLSIGLSTIANSTGLIAGDSTTGFELARISDGLGL
ncbi:translation initiation factor IF-6, partial [Candidatus Marsarchaeota archaeon]|nr:translation initiation factor IF-6 [Candidatus Marsarchaeota archaeon]